MRWLAATLLPCALLASSLTSLYSTLDPSSIAQHFAFYELYPDTDEGRSSLKHAWELLAGGCADCEPHMSFPTLDARPIIALVNRSSTAPKLEESQLALIEKLAKHLPNRKLKGHNVWTWDELIALEPQEVDLGHALLVAENNLDRQTMRSYEATLDLMALQILARLKADATPLEKVRVMNDYIFSELRFRFPPHSLHVKQIDLYTLLPSVIDSRRGVCLGVSILYLSLAQRLNLNLEAITPPGHIYVRYKAPSGEITNIETTARGIDVPSERYLSLETRKLQERNIKEVIGLAFMNQASVAWHQQNTQLAIELYEKGVQFLPGDPLIRTFLGFQYLFANNVKKGKALLASVQSVVPDHVMAKDPLIDDYLSGAIDAAGIQAIFQEVDASRTSILAKQKELATIVAKFPKFRSGHFHLAITYLQLGREKEAIPILERYMELDATNPTVCYYLAALSAQRLHYTAAWKYLALAEALVKKRDAQPRALSDFRASLERACPEPV